MVATVRRSPSSWTVAQEHTVKWTASRTHKAHVPKTWGVLHDHVLLLKDTRRVYRNRLEAPGRFVYQIPTHPTKEWEAQLVRGIRKRVLSGDKVWVHLFSTPGSRDEFFGEWVVQELIRDVVPGTSELVLRRLRDQSPDVSAAYGCDGGGGEPREEEAASDPYRSINEGVHADLLETLLPGWTIRHEPETLLDIHEPSVIDGVVRTTTDMTSSYTCDFVACRARCDSASSPSRARST